MLIRKERKVINLNSTSKFMKVNRHGIEFYFYDGEEGSSCFYFESEEETDKAFEKILDSFRFQRQVCDLN